MNTEELKTRSVRTFMNWIANIEPAKNQPFVVEKIVYGETLPLIAFRCGDLKQGRAMCRFLHERDAQEAFNELVSSLPQGMEAEVREWPTSRRISWSFIPPANDPGSGDLIARAGYIGACWSES